MKTSKAIEGYFISKNADGYSKSTLEMYQWALGLMCKFLDDPNLEEIKSAELKFFFSWLRNSYQPTRSNKETYPLTERSIENIWTAMRSFFKWAENEQLIKTRRDLVISRPRYALPTILPYSQDDVLKLLSYCKRTRVAKTENRHAFTMPRKSAKRDAAMILLLLDTGIRVSECARLKIKDVNLETGEVEIVGFGTGRKTKERHVHIGKKTRQAVWHYLNEKVEAQPGDLLFQTVENRPMDRSSISKVLRRLGDVSGVPDVHPHRFRHTFAIEYLRNQGDIFTLQRMLGHSSLEMVKRYLELSQTDDREAHRKASPVDRWNL